MKKIFLFFVLTVVLLNNVLAQIKKPALKFKEEAETTIIVSNEDYNSGYELFLLNKPKEAIPFFEKCIDVENIDPNVYIYLGVAYYQIGDFTRSLAICVKGLAKDNTNHKVLAYNAGNSAYALGNYARADACYAIAIKDFPDFTAPYLNRANAQLKQDHLQDAKENYIKYLELEPNDPQRENIEKLIALLSQEIERRAKEKPELINLDEMNVQNSSIVVENNEEKVNYDLPEEKLLTDDVTEELVKFDIAVAPELPKTEEKEIVEKEETTTEKTVGEYIAIAVPPMPEKSVDETVAEKITRDDVPVYISTSVDSEKTEVKDDFLQTEIIADEDLPSTQYALPAGKVAISVSTPGFSPNSPDFKKQKQIINVSASNKSNISNYKFEILDEYGNTVKTVIGKKIPKEFEWDGKSDSGKIEDGKYTAKLSVDYGNGNFVNSEEISFNCFNSKPKLSVDSEPDDFSPDGDGINDKLKIKVASESDAGIEEWKFEVKSQGKTIYTLEGKGNPKDFEWDGKDKNGIPVNSGTDISYSLSVTDKYGQVSSNSNTVHVERSAPEPVVAKKVEVKMNEDGTVDINIPTLSFKINSSELTDTKQNNDTLKKVYEILSDKLYEDFKVLIIGYVNPDGDDWTEEEKVLALNRAKSVEQKLIKLGINSSRFNSLAGSGKTSNKEFNRRVEFKLTK